MSTNDMFYEKTMENIRECLMHNEKHSFNTIGETIGGSSEGFMAELLSDDRAYFLKIRVDKPIEHVIVELYPYITVEKHYIKMVRSYMDRHHDNWKLGSVHIGGGNSICFKAECSFVEAPVSIRDFDRTLNLILKMCFDLEDSLDMLAHGDVPEDMDKEQGEADSDRFRKLMEQIRGRRNEDSPEDEEDEDSEEETEEEGGGESLLDMLMRIRAAREAEMSGEEPVDVEARDVEEDSDTEDTAQDA